MAEQAPARRRSRSAKGGAHKPTPLFPPLARGDVESRGGTQKQYLLWRAESGQLA